MPRSASNDTADEDQPIRASCDQCRARKLRCAGADRRTPSAGRGSTGGACARCFGRGQPCTFSEQCRGAVLTHQGARKRMGRPRASQQSPTTTPSWSPVTPSTTPTLLSTGLEQSTSFLDLPELDGDVLSHSAAGPSAVPLGSTMIWSPRLAAMPSLPATSGSLPVSPDLSMDCLDWLAVPEGWSNPGASGSSLRTSTVGQYPSTAPSPLLGSGDLLTGLCGSPSMFTPESLCSRPSTSASETAAPGADGSHEGGGLAHDTPLSTPAETPSDCFCHAAFVIDRLRGLLRGMPRRRAGTTLSCGDCGPTCQCPCNTRPALPQSPIELALHAAQTASGMCLASDTCKMCVADPSTATAMYTVVSLAIQSLRLSLPSLLSARGDGVNMPRVVIGSYQPPSQNAKRLVITAVQAEVNDLAMYSRALVVKLDQGCLDNGDTEGHDGIL